MGESTCKRRIRHRDLSVLMVNTWQARFLYNTSFLSTFFYTLNIKVTGYKYTHYWAVTSEQNWGPLALFIMKQHSLLGVDPAEKAAEFPKPLSLVSAPAVSKQALSLSPWSPRGFASVQTSPTRLDAFASQLQVSGKQVFLIPLYYVSSEDSSIILELKTSTWLNP